MSEHIKWTREDLAQQLDAWDDAMSKGEAVQITLHAADKYQFPQGMAYWLESPVGIVSLTLVQAQIVQEWLERKRQPRKESESSPTRDNQFAGFAEKLERDLHFLAFSMYHNHHSGDEVMLAYRNLIAQRAYDLVMHAVSETTGIKSIDHVPDMRQWLEEMKE